MKTFILSIILLISLNSFSQIGEPYEKVFKMVKEDKDLYNVEKAAIDNESYSLMAETKINNVLLVGYYFKTTDNICFKKAVIYNNELLNDVIKQFNSKYTKVSEYKWKYNNQVVVITKASEKTFLVEMKLAN